MLLTQLANEAGILPGGQMLIGTATTRKQALAWLSAADPEVVVQRLPRHLGQLEANRSTRLPLADGGAVDGVAVGRHVIDTEGNEVATTAAYCRWRD